MKIVDAAKILGKLHSPLKAAASRRNGKMGGRPRKKEVTPEDLLKNINHTKNGCWEWNGKVGSNGYAFVWHKKRPQSVHRLSWLFFRGEIPKGLYVCHRCDNRKCINPKHLWIGTASQNMRDCVKKNRCHRGGSRPWKHK